MKKALLASVTAMTAIITVSTVLFVIFALRLEHDVFYVITMKKALEYYLACLAEAAFFAFAFAYFSHER